MKNLKESIKQCGIDTERIQLENPTISKVWFSLESFEISEMQSYAKEINEELCYSESHQALQLQLSFMFPGATIFAYSVPCRVSKLIETPPYKEPETWHEKETQLYNERLENNPFL